MAPAFLFVESEPGSSVSLEEYHDWYDNEHIPLRMSKIPEFLTGARYQAIDGKKPSWTAAYEISDLKLFEDERYTSLRANRSPREADVVKRLETLDRRIYSNIYDSRDLPDNNNISSSKPTAAILTAAITPTSESEFHQIYKDEHFRLLRKIPGWIRSHQYKLVDSLVIGEGKEPRQNASPTFFTIHEYDSEDFLKTPEFKISLETKPVKRLAEISQPLDLRAWKLYRAWENTATKA